jgi:hypothetical protein
MSFAARMRPSLSFVVIAWFLDNLSDTLKFSVANRFPQQPSTGVLPNLISSIEVDGG